MGHWLAARYKRAAFPDELLKRLGNKILKAITQQGSKNPYVILGIWLDYDPQTELEDDSELYELWIKIVYKSDVEGAEGVAREAAAMLKQRFEREFVGEDARWNRIELQHCEAVSEYDFSVAEATQYHLFRLDYVSLRQSPTAELPDAQ